MSAQEIASGLSHVFQYVGRGNKPKGNDGLESPESYTFSRVGDGEKSILTEDELYEVHANLEYGDAPDIARRIDVIKFAIKDTESENVRAFLNSTVEALEKQDGQNVLDIQKANLRATGLSFS